MNACIRVNDLVLNDLVLTRCERRYLHDLLVSHVLVNDRFRLDGAIRVPTEWSVKSRSRRSFQKRLDHPSRARVQLVHGGAEAARVLKSLPQGTDDVFVPDVSIAQLLGDLTEQVRVDGGMIVGERVDVPRHLSQHKLRIDFCGLRND